MSTPPFTIVSRKTLPKGPRVREKRTWGPVIEALEAGKVLWFDGETLSDQDVKYLALAFARRGGKFRLRTKRVADGRFIEAVES